MGLSDKINWKRTSLNYEFMHNNIVFKDVHGRSYSVSLLAKQHAPLANEWLF